MTFELIAPAVFGLIGAVIGVFGSLAGVLLSTRTAREQARLTQRTVIRSEKKESVVAYLRTLQECQEFVSRIVGGPQHVPAGLDVRKESSRFENEIWLPYKTLSLVASSELKKEAFENTQRMDDAMFKGLPDGEALWPFLTPQQDKFLDAAQQDINSGVWETR